MSKDKKYRIVESAYYNRGESGSAHYEVHFMKRFLWFRWWSPLTEPAYDCNNTMTFKTIEEAEDVLEKHKNGNTINGWRERIVYADPDFKTIEK